ncbi:hypothetical protein MMC21_005858 [Puttea exsequens]|nr:hypothetical protein [Puttea exsequens]
MQFKNTLTALLASAAFTTLVTSVPVDTNAAISAEIEARDAELAQISAIEARHAELALDAELDRRDAELTRRNAEDLAWLQSDHE